MIRITERWHSRTPLEAMTVIKSFRSNSLVNGNPICRRYSQLVRAFKISELNQLQNVLDNIDNDVKTRVTKNRTKNIDVINCRNFILEPRITFPDFVMIQSAQRKEHKLEYGFK